MKLSCKDINPDLNCDYEAQGNTATEVAKKMMNHIKSAHPNEIKGMPDSEVMKMFESKVRS
jgi:predicted small metal-binding protein